MVITFGFLVIDQILNEEIWVRFLSSFKKNHIRVNLLVHSKSDVFQFNFPFIKVNKQHTQWDKLVNAELELIQESLNLRSDYFCLLSPNCLPIQNPEHFYEILRKLDGKSLLPNSRIWFTNYIKTSHTNLWGGHQWFVINADLSRKILSLREEILILVDEVNWVDCEFAIQTAIFRNGFIDESIINKTPTYTNWNFPVRGGSSPKWLLNQLSPLDIYNLITARKSEILFARKFNNLSELKKKYYYKILEDQINPSQVLFFFANLEMRVLNSIKFLRNTKHFLYSVFGKYLSRKRIYNVISKITVRVKPRN